MHHNTVALVRSLEKERMWNQCTLFTKKGATGAQNLWFPIDIDCCPYNSVMHYRATLWCVDIIFQPRVS